MIEGMELVLMILLVSALAPAFLILGIMALIGVLTGLANALFDRERQ